MLEILNKEKGNRYKDLKIDSVFKTSDNGRYKTEWICTSGDLILNVKYVVGVVFISMAENEYDLEFVSPDTIGIDRKIESKDKEYHINKMIFFEEIRELFNWKMNCDVFD